VLSGSGYLYGSPASRRLVPDNRSAVPDYQMFPSGNVLVLEGLLGR